MTSEDEEEVPQLPKDEEELKKLAEEKEKEEYFKIKSMADQLRIPFKKAQEIHEMTSKKGIHSKTLEEE